MRKLMWILFPDGVPNKVTIALMVGIELLAWVAPIYVAAHFLRKYW
jgi:hypothetical protein